MNSQITPVKDSPSLKAIWNDMFLTKDPFELPFQPTIAHYMIFYPTYGYHLTKEQYSAVVEAAKAIGDTGFYISVVEYDGDFFEKGEHWLCPFSPHEDYLKLPLVLENAIYSRSGKWGLIISHEDHAIIGGSDAFVRELRSNYNNWETDILELRVYWKDNKNSDWLEKVLASL